jgi:hypothetical protein
MDNLEKLLEKYFSIANTTVKIVSTIDTDKTFYIYTSGLAHNDIINIWKQRRYNNIINQIPDYFNNIIIYHYDPFEFYPSDKKKEINDKKKEINDNINTIIKTQDNESNKTNKKTTQNFIQDYFDVTKIDKSVPYLVLDFAHIYYYNYDNSTKEFFLTTETDRQKIDYINCIYIPFPSSNISLFEDIKYFEYDHTNKKITSYIELYLTIMEETIELIHVENIKDRALQKLYQGKIYEYVRSTKSNKVIPPDEYDWLDDNIRTPLLMDYFKKLFEPNMNKNKLLSIDNYEIYNKVKEKFKP